MEKGKWGAGMKMGKWKKIAYWGTAFAAVLSLVGCQDNGGSEALSSEAAGSPSPGGAGSAGTVSPSPGAKDQTAALPEELKLLFVNRSITPVSYTPAESGAAALLRLQGLQPPGLGMETLYRDMFYGIGNALKWAPFRVEDEGGAAVMETDSASRKAFRLAKIGGEAYYFDKESIRNYQPVDALTLPQAQLNPLLQAGLEQSWKPGALAAALGKPDSSFNGFDIYFRQQVEVKEEQILSSIIFRKEYTQPVLGALGTSSARTEIESLLGKPAFEETAPIPVFGYKLEPFYLFFAGGGPPYDIAVYPRKFTGSIGGPELPELAAANTGENGINVQQLVDQMRDKWPDYKVFSYGRGSYGVTYPHRGIWTDDLLGGDTDYKGGFIQLYGNYEGQLAEGLRLPQDADKLKALAASPDWPDSLAFYQFRFQEDMVFNQEKDRLREELSIRESAAKEGAVSPNGRVIAKAKDNTTYEHAGLYLLYPDKEQPPREVHIGNFLWNINWLSDRYVIFEVSFRGIVGYDTVSNKIIDIKVTPDYSDDYRLVEVKDGIIRYTNGDKEAELPYSFNGKGDLVLP
ncbi:hypothetical protein [Paenibacillus sp. YN15]|uniref:hypothetical protein n=1 Tax=Paenibacillus sp. YN15 TaxID=1742774 RepID=UPI000DCB7574|nr:hypothetical protein [Paenibacillus sp. YN15]RAU97888.1 hypothetical protein DQG13_18060 [Paenibacillus sp. YN15]